MTVSEAKITTIRGRSGLGPALCLIAVVAQLLALPLHERQIAALTSSGPSRSPASTLPLGGHDDANCAVCVAAFAARAAAPAERISALPPPAIVVEPARRAGVPGTGGLHAPPSDPRAPPHLS